MKTKTVKHTICAATGKRSFEEHDVEKALGRARTKRTRGANGSRRGLAIENRYYPCNDCDGFHLTHLSRRQYQNYYEMGAVA